MELGKSIVRLDVDEHGELRLVFICGESWDLDMNDLLCEQAIAQPHMREHYEEALRRLYWRTRNANDGGSDAG